jgi:hypothetical protein
MEPELYADTLRVAADTLGGRKNLARQLGVDAEELALWMSGERPAPLEQFVAALDIIGERPYLMGGEHKQEPA